MITTHWDLGVPYFQVQTHSCCQIRERELVVDPPERDEKTPVLANCLMLMPNVIETEINIHIYIYIGIKTTNQTKYPPVIKHGLLKNPPSYCAGFPRSNFHFDRGCPIIFTRTGAAEIAADFMSSPDFTLTIFTPAATLEMCQGPG